MTKMLSSTQLRRQLYTECRENGVNVPLSRTCCRETTDLQFRLATSTAGSIETSGNYNSYSTASDTCYPVDLEDIKDNFGRYCEETVDEGTTKKNADGDAVDYATIMATGSSTSTTRCTYDVRANNDDCATRHEELCAALGGFLFEADVTLKCDEFEPLLHIQNSPTCLGVTCGKTDLKEYLWVAADAAHANLGPCRVVQVNGQSWDQFQRTQTANKVAVVGGLIGVILVLGVATTLVAALRRSRLQKEMEAANMEPLVLDQEGTEVDTSLEPYDQEQDLPYLEDVDEQDAVVESINQEKDSTSGPGKLEFA